MLLHLCSAWSVTTLVSNLIELCRLWPRVRDNVCMYIMLAIKIHLHKQTIHWATLFIELRRLFLLSIPPGRQMRTQNSLLMSDCSNLELLIWSNISECWFAIERPTSTSTLTSAWKSNLVREVVTGAGWLGPNFFDTKQYPACASPKLCEFIISIVSCALPYYWGLPQRLSLDGTSCIKSIEVWNKTNKTKHVHFLKIMISGLQYICQQSWYWHLSFFFAIFLCPCCRC